MAPLLSSSSTSSKLSLSSPLHRSTPPPLMLSLASSNTIVGHDAAPGSAITTEDQASHNGATYNGRRPPRHLRNRRSSLVDEATDEAGQSSHQAVSEPTSPANQKVSVPEDRHECTDDDCLECWNVTDWESTAFDSNASCASQTSLYHVLDELEEQDCEDLEDDDLMNSFDNFDYRSSHFGLGDSEHSGPPGLVDISDRTAAMDISDRTSSSFNTYLNTAPKKRGSFSSSKAFKRSLQNVLQRDEDFSSSFFLRMSSNSMSKIDSSERSGGGMDGSEHRINEDWSDEHRRNSGSDLGHVLGDLMLGDDLIRDSRR